MLRENHYENVLAQCARLFGLENASAQRRNTFLQRFAHQKRVRVVLKNALKYFATQKIITRTQRCKPFLQHFGVFDVQNAALYEVTGELRKIDFIKNSFYL